MYSPKQGDIVLLEFEPTAWHEKKETHLVVVVSNQTFNAYTKLAMVCPIKEEAKDSPLHISLPEESEVSGTILCEQLKSLNIVERNPKWMGKVSASVLAEVVDIAIGSVEIEESL